MQSLCAFENFLGEVILFNRIGCTEDNRSLNRILQLADIARPQIILKERLGFGADTADDSPVLFSILLYEIARQYENVFRMVSQRRRLHIDDIQSVVEVLAEFSGMQG